MSLFALMTCFLLCTEHTHQFSQTTLILNVYSSSKTYYEFGM